MNELNYLCEEKVSGDEVLQQFGELVCDSGGETIVLLPQSGIMAQHLLDHTKRAESSLPITDGKTTPSNIFFCDWQMSR